MSAREGRLADISGALLLGGASRRMGRDKARLVVEGEALATRGARLLARLFEDVVLVGGAPPDDAPGRRVPDPPGPQSAMRGLVGALAAARGARVLVVATDLPALRAELLLALVAAPEADCVVPVGPAGPEPLCALYRREPVLGAARAALAEGRLAMRGLLEGGLSVYRLAGDDLGTVSGEGRALTNLNTPEELEAFRGGAGSATLA